MSSTYIGFITPTSTCSSQMPNTICHPRYKPLQGTHRWCLELLAPSHQFELPPNYHSVPLYSRHQILSQQEANNCACCASVSGSQYPLSHSQGDKTGFPVSCPHSHPYQYIQHRMTTHILLYEFVGGSFSSW